MIIVCKNIAREYIQIRRLIFIFLIINGEDEKSLIPPILFSLGLCKSPDDRLSVKSLFRHGNLN